MRSWSRLATSSSAASSRSVRLTSSASRSPVSSGSNFASKSRTMSAAITGFSVSACSMYSTEKVALIWRRYMLMARRITI